MIDEDQATFVFMNSKSSQEQLLQERDTVKELLQQALVRHRQMVTVCSCLSLSFIYSWLKNRPRAVQIKIKKRKSKFWSKMHIYTNYICIW